MLRNKLFQLMVAALATLFIVSCNKEPNLIGLDLLPGSDRLGLNFTDTSSIVAYSVREEELRTDDQSDNIIGYFNDPLFGQTIASVYTQIYLPQVNYSFGESPIADSIVLNLVYSGVTGDSLAQHSFKVFSLADTMSLKASYYSNSSKKLDYLIGEATFVPNIDSVFINDTTKVPGFLRIKLSNDYANFIINSSSTSFSTFDAFTSMIKGLYINAMPAYEPNSGSLLHFNLKHENTNVVLYYHNSKDTTQAIFPINSNCATFNHYIHSYNDADIDLKHQLSGNSTSGNDRVFLQSMAGVRVKIRLPYVQKSPLSRKMAVNEAILVIPRMEQETVIPQPKLLGLRKLDKKGEYEITADEYIGSNYFGGNVYNGDEYRFRVTKYVQDLMMYPDSANYGLMLFSAGGSLFSSRTLLYGPASEQNRMKLLIYYTELD